MPCFRAFQGSCWQSPGRHLAPRRQWSPRAPDSPRPAPSRHPPAHCRRCSADLSKGSVRTGRRQAAPCQDVAQFQAVLIIQARKKLASHVIRAVVSSCAPPRSLAFTTLPQARSAGSRASRNVPQVLPKLKPLALSLLWEHFGATSETRLLTARARCPSQDSATASTSCSPAQKAE